MVLENLAFPWSWSSYPHSSSQPAIHQRKKSKKSHVRSSSGGDRTTTTGLQNGSAKHSSRPHKEDKPSLHYPGLVNISGTYCFMNSTLQALASLSYLQPQIDVIHAKAELLDVPSPVIDALRDLLHALNSPHHRPSSIEPHDIIQALANHSPGKNNSLFSSREHQDAQELFQFLSECVKAETAAIDKEGHRDRGLGGLAESTETKGDIGKTVFDGLTANRRSCIECGYTEAVMHFAFDNWQLAVPRSPTSCALEDCLADYTRLELLTDCICRKCSMLATHKRLLHEADKLADVTRDPNASVTKKKRLRDVRKMAAAVKAALDEGRIEEDIKGLRLERVMSKASTKQAMIARPPPVLALHLNRSVHHGQYASKNNIRIVFPEILDLTPFTTSGKLSTVASAPISSPPPTLPRSTTPTPATYATPRTLYRLSAVVCHYGHHSFGHYVCFRRTPRPPSTGSNRFSPPTLSDPLAYVQASSTDPTSSPPLTWEDEEPAAPGRGWLRISDESTRECGIESVLAEGAGAFMLYYERVAQPRLGMHYSLRGSPRSSEETLKAETLTLRANGSVASLAVPVGGEAGSTAASAAGAAAAATGVHLDRSVVVGPGVGVLRETKKSERALPGARVVRSVAAGRSRGRSMSAAPSPERERERETHREASVGSLAPSRTPKPPGSVLSNGTTTTTHLVNGNALPSASASTSALDRKPSLVNGHTYVNGIVDSPLPSLPPPPPSPPLGSELPLKETPLASPVASIILVAPTKSSSSSSSSSSHQPPRIQSPQPVHPAARSPMVGLQA